MNFLKILNIKTITLLFLNVILFNNQLVARESFQLFLQKNDITCSINELINQKKIQASKFKRTSNTYYSNNVNYLNYVLARKNGDINQSLSHLNSILINSKAVNTEQIAWINYLMASTATNIKAYKVAEVYAFNALRLAKNKKYGNLIENIYSEIGINYYSQKLYPKAALYFKKAYFASKNKPSQLFFALSATNDIGVCYRKMKNNEVALKYHRKAYEQFIKKSPKTYQDIRMIYLLKGNIGTVLSDLHQYDEAIKLLTEEINYYYLHTEFLDIGAARTIIDLIEAYEIKKDQKNIDRYISKLVSLEKQQNDSDISLLIDRFLYEYYLRNNNPGEAIKLTKRLIDQTTKSKDEAIDQLSITSNLVYSQQINHLKESSVTNTRLLKHAINEKKTSQLVTNITILFFVVVIIFAGTLYRTMKKNMAKNTIIAKQNFQIVESINYSKKIQDALLPTIEDLRQILPHLFIFYHPKNIVSGDFYWCKKFESHTILACVDCTGHGVPGAFMSTIGSLILDKITTETIISPSEILSLLNDEIIRILNQQKDGEIQDGMDLSICIIDHLKKQVSFSGARNGITLIKNGVATRYKANLLPVGGNYRKKGKTIDKNFTYVTIDIDENDWIYMYTDGFIEQIGGPSNMPMNHEQYEQILCKLSKIDDLDKKIQCLHHELDSWKGLNEYTDDMLIMGFKIT